VTAHSTERGTFARESLMEDEGYRLPLKRRASLAYETYERPALFLLAVASLVLGFIGYRRYFLGQGRGSYVDALLSDLDLFKLRPNIGEGNIPVELNIARVLSPLIAGLVAFRSAAVLFRERLDHVRTRRRRDHVVVVGCNSTSWPLIRALRRADTAVTVLDELDPGTIVALRAIGALGLSSNRSAPERLHQARVERATHVIAMLDNDFANLDHGLCARRLLASRKDRPQILVCGHQPDFCGWLRLDDLVSSATSGPRLDFISGDERLAHEMVDLLPSRGKVLVFGQPIIEAHILLRLARTNASSVSSHSRAGWSAIVETGHRGACVEVARRSFAGFDAALPVTDVERIGDAASNLVGVVGAIICGTDASTVVDALELANRLPPEAMVVAALPAAATYTSLVPSTQGARVAFVDTSAWASDLELVLDGTFEVIARAVHQRYRDEHPGTTADASTLPWSKLSPQLKASNRAQAKHLGVKLAAVGATLAPLGGHHETFGFTRDERERLAVMEHDRWVEERRAAGWTSGPRDVATLKTPHLVPWEELTAEVKDLDRSAVDGLPSFLADVGYRIERIERSLTDPTIAT
jgi:RyR domain/TrkA-N domain